MSYISIHRVPRTIRLRCLPLALGVLALCGSACHTAETERRERPLPEPFQKLLPLHKKLGPPEPGDWLTEHFEPGQTYWEYVHGQPVKPEGQRRVIYVQPLGTFTQTQRKIVGLAAEYMGLYFGLPTRLRESLPLNLIPAKARRKHPSWGIDQILSTYVLKKVLAPRLPKDAVASIAFTASDLWPGEGWNFVFGQASLGERVGVWSIYRYGDPDQNDEAWRLCLLRTLKVGTHETGHMFSMQHCTLYECNMCAGNHLAEMDRYPLWLCPQCLAKLCWATGADPAKRFERLAEFSKKQGMKREQEFFEQSLARLREDPRSPRREPSRPEVGPKQR
ncbi:MAG: archaemetzincin [Thermoguttaceae bacterium]